MTMGSQNAEPPHAPHALARVVDLQLEKSHMRTCQTMSLIGIWIIL